jgi:hypothetical protein
VVTFAAKSYISCIFETLIYQFFNLPLKMSKGFSGTIVKLSPRNISLFPQETELLDLAFD